MSRRHDLVDIAVDIKARTELAILVSDGTREAWLPKSQVEFEWDAGVGAYVLTLPESLAVEKGLV